MLKKRREIEENCSKRCRELDEKLIDDKITQEELTEYEECKLELERISLYKARGEQIRSRIEQIESNEKSTKYFYNSAKQSYEKKTIRTLTLPDNTITHCIDTILSEITTFYVNLYTSNARKSI